MPDAPCSLHFVASWHRLLADAAAAAAAAVVTCAFNFLAAFVQNFTASVLLFVLLSCALAMPARALDAHRNLTQYVHTVWQVDQGLASNSVLAISQTPNGYLRLGLSNGLMRFDGLRFAIFDRIFESMPNVMFENMLTAQDGALWLATNEGVMRYHNGELTRYTIANGLRSDRVYALAEAADGAIWAGTFDGLSRIQHEQIITFTTSDGLADNHVSGVLAARDGALWVATRNGLSCLRAGRFENFTQRDGLAANPVHVAYEDSRGRLWFGTERGLSLLTSAGFRNFTSRDGLVDNSVFSLLEDRDGNLWVGTNGGLTRMNEQGFESFTTKQGLSDNTVSALFEDRAGNIWVGTAIGLNRLRAAPLITYGVPEGVAGDVVWGGCQTRAGETWIAAEGGLTRLAANRRTTTRFTMRDGLPHNTAYTAIEDRDGSLWIGTRAGLSRFAGNRFTNYTAHNGLPEGGVFALLEDRAGTLWVGTHAGLSRLRGNRFENFTIADGLANNFVNQIHEDKHGRIWIATRNGLSRYDGGRFTNYTTAEGLSHNDISAIYEDDAGALWLAVSSRGISRITPDGRISHATMRDGLADDYVWRILEDGQGHVWLSSNKGVSRVSRAELDALLDGKTKRVSPAMFGKHDGMRSLECNGGVGGAGWRARDGRLWFPTIKGVSVVDPQSVAREAASTTPVIEAALIGEREINPVTENSFAPQDNRIEFRYTAPALSTPERLRFRYRLDGLDREWVEADRRRAAFYTSLPPGEYSFRVMATDENGAWRGTNELPLATFSFQIRPHFYQTYWFALLLTVTTLGCGWLFVRLRARQIEFRAQQQFAVVLQERNRIAREVHDTLAQGFVGVSTHLEVVAELLIARPEQARKHLDRAQNLARMSLTEARRAVVNLRSPALETNDLETVLREFAAQLTAGSKTETSVARRGARGIVLPDKLENTLLRIGQEAIANAVRHAAPRSIRVELAYDSTQVSLRVADDGCGFDADAKSLSAAGGFGLRGMRERIAELGGKLNVRSRPSAGAVIEAIVPLAQPARESDAGKT